MVQRCCLHHDDAMNDTTDMPDDTTDMTGPPPPMGDARQGGAGSGDTDTGRRLARSNDKKVGGVAAGIAEYFRLDPTLVRLGLVLLLVLSFGSVLVGYLVMWAILPASDGSQPVLDRVADLRLHSRERLGWLVVAVLAVIVFSNLVLGDSTLAGAAPGILIPALLIGVGVLLLGRRGDAQSRSVPRPPGDPAAQAWVAPLTQHKLGTPAEAVKRPKPAKVPKPPKPPGLVTPIVLALMAFSAGVLLVVDQAGAADVTFTIGASIWLLLIAAGLTVSAFRGRAPGLIAIGVVVSLGTMVARVVDPVIASGAGNVTYTVTDPDDLLASYELGVGQLTVDLSQIDLDGAVRTVDIELGVGELVVRVSNGPALDITIANSVGDIAWTDRVEQETSRELWESGFGNDLTIERAGSSDGGSLVLNISSDIGSVRVTRVP